MAKKKRNQLKTNQPRDGTSSVQKGTGESLGNANHTFSEKPVVKADAKKRSERKQIQKQGQETMRQSVARSVTQTYSERDFHGRTDPKKQKEARKRRQKKARSEFDPGNSFTVDGEKKDSRSDKSTEAGRKQRKKKAVRDFANKEKAAKKQSEYSVEKVFDAKTGTAKYVVMVADGKKPVKKKYSNKRKYYDAVTKGKDRLTNQEETDDDYNAGVEGAEAAERQAERVIGVVHNYRRDAPYRRYQKLRKQFKKLNRQERRLEQKQIRQGAAQKYSDFLKQNPELNEKTLRHTMQKQAQKRRIRKEYAKAFRSEKAAKAAKEATQTAQKTTTVIAKKAQELLAKHASIVGAIALVLVLVILIMSTFSSCGAMFSQGMTGIVGGTYTSLPAEIDATDLMLTNLEMELQKDINNIETDYPDYDEYRYNLGEIGHDPFTLISYLSAKYESFTASEMQTEVENLFDEMYELTLTPVTETRTGTRTVHNEDGTTGTETYTYEVEILEVTLTVNSLDTLVAGKMNADQTELYQNYRVSNGMLQYFYSPLDLYWYNYVSSYYGYRVNPFTGDTQFHRGVDIAVPEGTPVYAGQDGTVTTAEYHEEYGNYVVIQDSKGYVSKYAHLSTLNVSAGQTIQHGRQIGKTGNTGRSTGSHLHIECMYNGEYYNPLFYFLTGEDTLYGERPGTSFAGDVEPPPSYDDPTANALLTEASRYIGYPYVWGGSSPSTSFDCSGFVCYVFTNSGVHNLPRTTAQGIYNQCTPVSASDAQPGDIIFFTGTYASSGPVSHVGIYCGDGVMVHAGDPIKYSNINTSYWQSHFYGFGRLSN